MAREVTRLASSAATGHASSVSWPWYPLRLVAVVTAAAMLVFGSVAGLGYFWCAPMGEARLLHCCCAVDDAPRTTDVIGRHCCEGRVLAELPAGLADHGSDVQVLATAQLVPAWLRAREPVARPRVAASVPVARARGSPGRRVHRDCSVYLL